MYAKGGVHNFVNNKEWATFHMKTAKKNVNFQN